MVEDKPTNVWRGTTGSSGVPALRPQTNAQTNTANLTQRADKAPEKEQEEERDPNLQPYLGTHVLKEDAYTESSYLFGSLVQFNVWLGYHQEVGQTACNWSNDAVGTPRYYKTLYTAQYSPTTSACIRKIINTAVGNGLEFKGKGLTGKDKIYANEVKRVLKKTLYSLLVFGDSYIYQNAEGLLDFWGLDILRINTAGGTRPIKAGIVKRTLGVASFFGEPDFPTSIYPRTDDAGAKGYSTVYRVLNESSTRTPWPEPEHLACELPSRNEYNAYAVGNLLFKNGVAPRVVITVSGADVTSDEFKAVKDQVKKQSSGLAANVSVLVVGADVNPEMGGDIKASMLNNSDIPSFAEHKKELRETILALWGLTPFLAGFQTPGGLGSVNQRNAEYVNFVENTIAPLRLQLEESLILPYFEYCDAYLGTKLLDKYIGFAQTVSLNYAESVDINAVTSINERRAYLGIAASPDPDADIPSAILDVRKKIADLETQVGTGATDPNTDPATIQPVTT